MGGHVGAVNAFLDQALHQLRWTRARLAEEVAARLPEKEHIGRSTAADWVTRGSVPSALVQSAIAQVFSEALREDVSPRAIWGEKARTSDAYVLATRGIPTTWDEHSTLRVLGDVLVNLSKGEAMMKTDRRVFGYTSAGAAAIGAAYAKHMHNVPSLASYSEGNVRITPESVDFVEQWIRDLRRADDLAGGTRMNRIVAHQYFATVADWLRNGSFVDSQLRRRLYRVAAQLSQICGWLSYDAGVHGAAQRYMVAGLHLAHTGNDRAIGSYLLHTLSEVSVFRGDVKQGVQLTNAARAVANESTNTVRSIVASGYALAQGATGHRYGMEIANAEAEQLLDDAADEREPWLYWADQTVLRCRRGYGLIFFAPNSSLEEKSALGEAVECLSSHKHRDGTKWPRETYVHKMWQAHAQLRQDDLDGALDTGWNVISMSSSSLAPRAIELVIKFEKTLGRRKFADYPGVNELRGELVRLVRESKLRLEQ